MDTGGPSGFLKVLSAWGKDGFLGCLQYFLSPPCLRVSLGQVGVLKPALRTIRTEGTWDYIKVLQRTFFSFLSLYGTWD